MARVGTQTVVFIVMSPSSLVGWYRCLLHYFIYVITHELSPQLNLEYEKVIPLQARCGPEGG